MFRRVDASKHAKYGGGINDYIRDANKIGAGLWLSKMKF